MNLCDLRVEHVDLTFTDEKLASPMHLSKGTIEEISYVTATLTVCTREGESVQGIGAILLSDVWAFPGTDFTHEQKDAAMRTLCEALAAWLPNDAWGDPLEKGMRLEEALGEVTQTAVRAAQDAGELDHAAVLAAMPRLAQLICLAPFDAALHDAWGRAWGRPVFACYTEEMLNRDLGTYLGPEFAGRYPADFLGAPRTTLRVQHVVGMGDALGTLPLHGAQVAGRSGPMGLPGDLVGWILRDGVSAFKLKTRGQDPAEDAARLIDTHTTAAAAFTRMGMDRRLLRLSVDPNEGCPDPAILVEMLDRLAKDAPDVLAALDYIEQPTGRDLSAYSFTLHDVAARVPVIIDESLESLAILPQLAAQGWSGLAVKTCKGHTHALLAYCWAKQHNQTVTLQDLTNIGHALVHSANLCAHLDLSFDYFECNQRQYLPHAQPGLRASYPAYFAVEAGALYVPASTNPGLY